MSKNRVPAQVWPLASYLAEEMKERGWDSVDVAHRMENRRRLDCNLMCLQLILAVQDDGLLIDDETFYGLAKAFGVDEKFFRNLDATWRKFPSRRVKFTCSEDLFFQPRRTDARRAAGEVA